MSFLDDLDDSPSAGDGVHSPERDRDLEDGRGPEDGASDIDMESEQPQEPSARAQQEQLLPHQPEQLLPRQLEQPLQRPQRKFEHAAKMRYAKLQKHMVSNSRRQSDHLRKQVEASRLHRRVQVRVVKAKTKSGLRSRSNYALQMQVRKKSMAGTDTATHGQKLMLTWASMSQMGADCSQMCRSALAASYGCSSQTCARMVGLVAHIGMERQLKQLSDLAALMMERPPMFAVSSLMWDETAQALSLRAIAGCTTTQGRSTWEVLVSKAYLTWSWGERVYNIELIMPPVPLASNSADCILDGLRCHPLTRGLWEMRRKILDSATVAAVEVHECDGHPANERLSAHLRAVARQEAQGHDRQPIACQRLNCGNHAANLVVCHMLIIVNDSALINNMFCCCKFIRMGGHFLRIVAAAQYLIRTAFFVWTPFGRGNAARAPSSSSAFREELAQYVENVHWNAERSMSQQMPGRRGRITFNTHVRRTFLDTFNGAYWERGGLSHECTSPTCCENIEAARAKAMAGVGFVFRAMPIVPEVAKWTKVLPALLFFMVADMGGLLENAFARAAESFAYPQHEGHPQAEESAEIDWQRLAGGRLRRSRMLIGDSIQRLQIVALSIVMEPLQMLHARSAAYQTFPGHVLEISTPPFRFPHHSVGKGDQPNAFGPQGGKREGGGREQRGELRVAGGGGATNFKHFITVTLLRLALLSPLAPFSSPVLPYNEGGELGARRSAQVYVLVAQGVGQ